MYVTHKSPKGGSNEKFLHLALQFFIAGNHCHFKINMQVEHSKSLSTDDKMSLKWALPLHVTHFKFLVALKISLEWLKLETLSLVCVLIIASPNLRTTNCP